jgi:hypothetical protein
MKLFIVDDFLLQVSNIYDNRTKFSNIYDYIATSLIIKYPNFSNIICKELVKKRVMPGIYGQSLSGFTQEAVKFLESNTS